VGPQRALELLLTGRILSGREAAEIGLVLEASPRDRVLSRALEIARDVAVHASPVSTSATKRLVWQSLEEADRAAAFQREQRVFRALAAGDDCREGVSAFLEKRSPRWGSSKRAIPPPLGADED
jgi:enoyl-CoA hydratase/carnithine racemase